MKRIFLLIMLFVAFATANGQLALHSSFGDHMVLQREKPVKIWGTAPAKDTVEVSFANQVQTAYADDQGLWHVFLDPLTACRTGQTLKVTCKQEAVLLQDVLVGDVWLLTGQSNMEFDLARIHQGDAEIVSAHYPEIRLLTMPAKADPEPQRSFLRMNEWDGWYGRYDIKGFWLICSPETVPTFSALGYVFGRRVHMASQVPIGLVDISWGGTTIEGWISHEWLLKVPENQGLLDLWEERIRQDPEKAFDRNNPGASYNGMMVPLKGMALKGIIWHQGFNNALGDSRPKLYTKNLQLMIELWRDFFNDSELPFGIIELSAGGSPQTLDNFHEMAQDAGTFIREAQLQAYKDLDHVGFVAAYDEQVNWYHPQRKEELAERMARWALKEYYGFDLGWEPALVVSAEQQSGKFIVEFSKEVIVPDGRPIEGMALAGKNRVFYPAKASYLVTGKDDRNQDIIDRKIVVVSCDQVPNPQALRYAWARNPLGNLTNAEMAERVIPVPAFRTDSWEWPEAPFVEGNTEAYKAHRQKLQEMKKTE